MARQHRIKTKPGQRSGEYVVTLPPGWELRLRRVLREVLQDTLPDPRAEGLTGDARAKRVRLRQERMREALCAFISDLIAADIVGKEVALSTRNRYGRRVGSLREHVAAILREEADSPLLRRGQSPF